MSTRVRLSPHFHLDEFDPHGGGTVPAVYVEALRRLCVIALEPVRVHYGACTIISGYRTIAHNAAVGGAPNSHHLYAAHPSSPAADVAFAKGTPRDWEGAFLALARNRWGIGRYTGHVHVDLRLPGARW